MVSCEFFLNFPFGKDWKVGKNLVHLEPDELPIIMVLKFFKGL